MKANKPIVEEQPQNVLRLDKLLGFKRVAEAKKGTEFSTALGATINKNGEIPSDARLKSDITYLETLPNGVKLYSFKYRADLTTTYVGVLAQDLLASKDHAVRRAVVTRKDGYYAVDYRILGFDMLTLSAWQAERDFPTARTETKPSRNEAASPNPVAAGA
jgi:hypothetical protein